MIILNNEPIYVFPYDTFTTLHRRVAAFIYSFPEYVILETDLGISMEHLIDESYRRDITIQPINLLHHAQQEQTLGALQSLTRLFDPFIIARIWFLFHHDINQVMLFFNQNQITDSAPLLFDIERYEREQRDTFKEQLFTFITDEERLYTMCSEFHTIQPTDIHVFKPSATTLRQRCFIQATLNIVFDYFKVDTVIPFATFQSMYKVYRTFDIPSNWQSFTDRIHLRYHDHGQMYIVNIISDGDDAFIIETHLSSDLDAETLLHQIVHDVLERIDLATTMMDEIQPQYKGYIAYASPLDPHIIDMLLLTNPFLSNSMASHDNMTIRETPSHRSVFYQNMTDVSVNETAMLRIHTKIAGTNDPFPTHTPFTMIRIVQPIHRRILTQLFYIWDRIHTMYYSQYRRIIDMYRSYLPDTFQHTDDTERPPPDRRSEYIFGPQTGYTRACSKYRQPVLVDTEDQAEQYRREGRQLMTFPIEPVQVHHDTIQPEQFVCLDPQYPYPGLIRNQRMDVLHYQPCCFKTSQMDKTTSKYNQYRRAVQARDEDPLSVRTPIIGSEQTQYIKITDKIIVQDQIGQFPELTGNIRNDLTRLFNAADEPHYVILRYGIEYGPHSFLRAVHIALQRDDSVAVLEQARRAMARDDHLLALGRQEMWDMTIEEQRAYFATMDTFLDPRRTLSIIEYVYECSILLFAKTRNQYGSMIQPFHTQSYYRSQRDTSRPTIMIYLHEGAPIERLTTPHCELLIRTTIDERSAIERERARARIIRNPSTRLLRLDDENTTQFYQYLWNVYDTMFQTYARDQPITPIGPYPFTIEGQSIDHFGKARAFKLQHSTYPSHVFMVHTTPVAPVYAPIVDEHEETPLTYQQAIAFLQHHTTDLFTYRMHGIHQYVRGRRAPFIHWTIRVCSQQHQQHVSSQYQQFRRNQHLARILSNWIYYLYSQFLHQQPHQRGIAMLAAFVDRYTIIDPTFQYGQVSPFFDLQHSDLFQDQKLVLTSTTLRNQLIYQLRLQYERNPSYIKTFHTRTFLDRYYMYTSDYQTQPDTRLFHYDAELGLRLDIKLRTILHFPSFNLVSRQPIESRTPYFYRHPQLHGGRVVLLQPVSDASRAVQMDIIWHTDGYNHRDHSDEEGVQRGLRYSVHVVLPDQTIQVIDVNQRHRRSDNDVWHPMILAWTSVDHQQWFSPIYNFSEQMIS